MEAIEEMSENQYIGFRIGNDKSGKYRYWDRIDSQYGCFSVTDEAGMEKIRAEAANHKIPVYFFDMDVDEIEDAVILATSFPLCHLEAVLSAPFPMNNKDTFFTKFDELKKESISHGADCLRTI